MTDRQVGALGAQIDAVPLQTFERQTDALGLTVDLVPPLTFERQTDALGLRVEYAPPTGDVAGALALTADIVAQAARQVGALFIQIDFVATAGTTPSNAARWSGVHFDMGTSPLTYWSSGAFRTSGTKPNVWVTNHFEEAP